MQVLSESEVAEFRKAAADDRHGIVFDFLLGTGCRPGEALAVRWADLDLAEGVVRIRRSLAWLKGVPTFKDPKTAGSRRSIPLPGRLVAGLSVHRRAQAAQILEQGAVYDREADLVFANEIGGPLELRNLTQRHFKEILKRAKLPAAVRLYDLRHTHATLLLAGGVHPKIASERLGHASTAMTLDVYSHVVPGMQHEAAQLIDRTLFW